MADEKPPLPPRFVQDVLGSDNVITDDSFEAEQRYGADGPADQKLAEFQGQQPQEPTIQPPRPEPQPQRAVEQQTAPQEQQPQTGLAEQERQELTRLREQQARLDERVNLIRELRTGQQQERERAAADQRAREEADRRAKERPDPLMDPHGAALFDVRETLAQQQQLISTLTERLTTTNQQRQGEDLQTWMSNDMGFARMRNPGFDQAIDHLRALEVEELHLVGIRDPQQIEQRLQAKLNWYAGVAAQNGVSIADAMYQRAVRLGFQAGAAPQPTQTAQPSVTVPAAPSSSQMKLDQIRKGQSLAGMGRTPTAPAPQQDWNMKDFLLTASDEEVSRLVTGPNGAQFLQMFEELETTGTVQ